MARKNRALESQIQPDLNLTPAPLERFFLLSQTLPSILPSLHIIPSTAQKHPRNSNMSLADLFSFTLFLRVFLKSLSSKERHPWFPHIHMQQTTIDQLQVLLLIVQGMVIWVLLCEALGQQTRLRFHPMLVWSEEMTDWITDNITWERLPIILYHERNPIRFIVLY